MRQCACNCGRSLANFPIRVIWHPQCQHKARMARRQREKEKARIERQHRPKPLWGEPPREPSRKCMSCAGMPSARTVDRIDCFHNPVGVDKGWGVVCYRCLQPWAPQEPLRIVGVIGSSAGTAAAHGVLFGLTG